VGIPYRLPCTGRSSEKDTSVKNGTKRNPKEKKIRKRGSISLNENLVSKKKWIRTSSELESEVDGLVMHFA
jgi:hypothetical protein